MRHFQLRWQVPHASRSRPLDFDLQSLMWCISRYRNLNRGTPTKQFFRVAHPLSEWSRSDGPVGAVFKIIGVLLNFPFAAQDRYQESWQKRRRRRRRRLRNPRPNLRSQRSQRRLRVRRRRKLLRPRKQALRV